VTSTFYDTRAERRVAAAVAEEHKAAAAERLAAAEAARAASRVEAKARGALLAEQAKERADERKAAQRAARQAARQARRTALRANVASSLPSWGMSALWASVIVAPLLLAWQAQMAFAVESLGIDPKLSWLFPLAIECGAWVCAFESHRRAKAGLPVGSLPMWMWLLAGIAAAINFVHGVADYGVPAGMALAAVSVLGVLLHHVRQGLDRATDDPAARLAEARKRAARWVWHPVLSLCACSISARTGTTADEAWEAAHRDRYGVGPAAPKRDRRLGRVISRRQWKADRKAAKEGRFVIVNGVILTLPDTPARKPAVVELVSSAPVEDLDEWVDPWERWETTEPVTEPTPIPSEPEPAVVHEPEPEPIPTPRGEEPKVDRPATDLAQLIAKYGVDHDRTMQLLANGAGRPTLVQELGVTPHQARQLAAAKEAAAS
jgi:hypothetical protein